VVLCSTKTGWSGLTHSVRLLLVFYSGEKLVSKTVSKKTFLVEVAKEYIICLRS